MDGFVRGTEVKGKLFREGFYGGFGGVISWISGRVGDALLACEGVIMLVKCYLRNQGLWFVLPVIMTAPGPFCAWIMGRKVDMPFMTPKRLVFRVWSLYVSIYKAQFLVDSTYFMEVFHILPAAFRSCACVQVQQVHSSPFLQYLFFDALPGFN
jgi:hypothetical protein